MYHILTKEFHHGLLVRTVYKVIIDDKFYAEIGKLNVNWGKGFPLQNEDGYERLSFTNDIKYPYKQIVVYFKKEIQGKIVRNLPVWW